MSKMDPLIILNFYKCQLYPTNEARFCSHFCVLSIPPNILNLKLLNQALPILQEPSQLSTSLDPDSNICLHSSLHGRTSISEILNGVIIFSAAPKPSFLYLPVKEMNDIMHIDKSSVVCIDSRNVFLTAAGNDKNFNSVSPSDRIVFDEAIKHELDFLLKDCVCPVLLDFREISHVNELQPFKLNFNIKGSSNPTSLTFTKLDLLVSLADPHSGTRSIYMPQQLHYLQLGFSVPCYKLELRYNSKIILLSSFPETL